jgi:hypothetical protein
MRRVMCAAAIAVFLSCHAGTARAQSGSPEIDELRLVARLPAELPQRVSGFAFDGEKFWLLIYHGGGRYATLDPASLSWTISDAEEQHQIIRKVAGKFESPGGLCFVNGKLWLAGAYGESFGVINPQTWEVERFFQEKQREDPASQTYAGMAFDGSHLWVAWHWFKYALPDAQTQLLLKVDLETGKVVSQYPAPAGTRNDATHALTWDGAKLWHMKDQQLASIDPATGAVIAVYTVNQVKRPSGLAWDGRGALWIAEWDGKIWRLPFPA